LGILSALFFAVTFVLNRKMQLDGGSWLWSASLRYFFMLPLLLAITICRKNLPVVFRVIMEHPGKWLLWSTVGFGLFYAPMCLAAAYSPGWLVAGTWQVTIISGSLLVPFFRETLQTEYGPIRVRSKIPVKGLLMSLVILLGIVLLQLGHAQKLSFSDLLWGVVPILIASFAYPLGNRKMMELCDGQLDVYQRVLGMTVASLPFWFILACFGLFSAGLPSKAQIVQSILVAVFSGVIATLLFFRATDMVRANVAKLAAVEATQSMEVLFALFGEIMILSAPLPTALSWSGLLIVMVGMILHSLFSHRGHGSEHTKEMS
jgi:drug/metabolite transporter (DMT)-like permease